MQIGDDGIDHPISYFVMKFDKHQSKFLHSALFLFWHWGILMCI